jgi:hypothetical protein
MALPSFIDLPGSSVYQHPYPLYGMNSQTFLLRAHYEQMVRCTDQWLNAIPGSPYRYVPLLPLVICLPVWINRIEWTPTGQGWMRESDFNFAYWVGAFRGLELDHIAIAQPYLIVDNPLTAFSGREVFGYRKSFGKMEYAAGTYQPTAASTWVFKSNTPDSELELAEVARINAPPGWPAATREAKWEDFLSIAEVVSGDLIIDAAMAVQHIVDHMKSKNVTVVYVLELRDVEYPGSSSFQALVESPMDITSLNSAWVLPRGFTVQLTDYPSYPLISNLGLKVDQNNVAEVAFAYQTNWDCILQPGRYVTMAGRNAPSS